jgi:hypothetical protein
MKTKKTRVVQERTAEGYTCSRCKRQHKYPGYVYAHWDVSLTHTCECGLAHNIFRGHASPNT